MAAELIKCENCGAEVDVHEPRCPYCNSFLYEGAEKEYWDKMGQIHEDLKDLGDVPENAYKKEVRSQVSRIGGWLKKGLLFLVILGGLWMVYTSNREMDDAEDKKSQMVWQQENFPKLDAWYEAGEYDKIIEVRNQLAEEGNYLYIWDWEHAVFIDTYEAHQILTEYYNLMVPEIGTEEDIQARKDAARASMDKKQWEENVGEMIYWLMEVVNWTTANRQESYTAEDWQKVQVYREEAWDMGCAFLEIEEQDMAGLWQKLCPDDLTSYKECQNYAEEWMKQEVGR